MARVQRVLARVHVDDLDAALPFYERLADGEPPRRFEHGGVALAWVGSFLLLAGSPADLAAVRDRVATVLVDDVDAVAAEVVAAGGELLDGPGRGPNGPRLIARHPDGAVVEYLRVEA